MAGQSAEYDGSNEVNTMDGLSSAKPVFFHQGREISLNAQDVYRGVGAVIVRESIRGIQRVGNLWRIYPDTTQDRVDLLTNGISIRGARITLVDANPFTPRYEGTKLTVHGIPLSASDTVISAALRTHGCVLTSAVERQLLRVDGQLTNCQTGGRNVYVKLPEDKHLPRSMETVYYRDQPSSTYSGKFIAEVTCKKCLLQGHHAAFCKNDWVCTACRRPGHKRGECPLDETTAEVAETATQASSQDNASQEDSVADHSEDNEVNEPSATASHPDMAAIQQQAKPDGDIKTRRRRKVKKKTTPHSAAPSSGGASSKITDFITTMRARAATDTTVSDSETPDGKRKARPVRSPKTPPEEQHDNSKRVKVKPGGDKDSGGT